MGYTIGMPSIKLNNVGQKSKHCGSFKKVAEEALEERMGLDLDINKELTSQNIYKGFKTAEDLMQYSIEHIAELDFNRPEGARKIRSDAVVMCGTILKPPADMMMSLSREEQQKFLEDAITDFSKIVREENVKSVVLHFDERVPHAHVFWEPMTSDGRLCAKEMHNLKFFGRLNREMPEMLRKQGWDIDNCQAYDKAEEDKKREEMGEEKYREYRKEKRKNRGKDSNTFKSAAEKELREIQQQTQQAKSELIATIEIPPRPVTPPPPEEPKKKTVYWDKDEEKQYYKEKKQHDKEMKVYQSKTLPKVKAEQAEWDEKYNLLQRVQEVHEEQQRTEEQQNQRAAIQEEKTEKLKKDRAELEQEKRTLPQKAQAMALEMLRRMEQFTEITNKNAAWEQRYEQIFKKQYTERIDNDDRTTFKTEQDIRNGSKSQQPERDS